VDGVVVVVNNNSLRNLQGDGVVVKSMIDDNHYLSFLHADIARIYTTIVLIFNHVITAAFTHTHLPFYLKFTF